MLVLISVERDPELRSSQRIFRVVKAACLIETLSWEQLVQREGSNSCHSPLGISITAIAPTTMAIAFLTTWDSEARLNRAASFTWALNYWSRPIQKSQCRSSYNLLVSAYVGGVGNEVFHDDGCELANSVLKLGLAHGQGERVHEPFLQEIRMTSLLGLNPAMTWSLTLTLFVAFDLK